MSYQSIAKEVADLVEEKQKAYGDSFGKSGEVLRILYPDGIPPSKLESSLTVVRVLDKLFRIATNPVDIMGESPWKDIVGYGLLELARSAPKGLSAIVGQWPGDETDEEVANLLGESVLGEDSDRVYMCEHGTFIARVCASCKADWDRGDDE